MLNLGNGIPDSGSLFPERWGALGNTISSLFVSFVPLSYGDQERAWWSVFLLVCAAQPNQTCKEMEPPTSQTLSGGRCRREAHHASGIAPASVRPGFAGEICRMRLKVSTSSLLRQCWCVVGVTAAVCTGQYTRFACQVSKDFVKLQGFGVSFQITFHISQGTIYICWQALLGRTEWKLEATCEDKSSFSSPEPSSWARQQEEAQPEPGTYAPQWSGSWPVPDAPSSSITPRFHGKK